MATATFQIQAGSVFYNKAENQTRMIVNFKAANGTETGYHPWSADGRDRDRIADILRAMTRDHDERIRTPKDEAIPNVPLTPVNVTVPDDYNAP